MKTKNYFAWVLSVLAVCFLLNFNAFGQADASAQIQHAPATQQFITMVEHNAELKKMLVKSIQRFSSTLLNLSVKGAPTGMPLPMER